MIENWIEFFGLFIQIAGFIVGLGAVTVIDIHGFLGQKSRYWTRGTIQAHKVTKPLIWLGVFLYLVGCVLFYSQYGFPVFFWFQFILLVVLVFNGLFLSFWVSPRLLKREQEGRAEELLPKSWQDKIRVSFIFSFLGWWGSVFLLVYFLLSF